jgi:hypothetical protein
MAWKSSFMRISDNKTGKPTGNDLAFPAKGKEPGINGCIPNGKNLRSFGIGQWASGLLPLPTKIILAGQRPTVLLHCALWATPGIKHNLDYFNRFAV